jgi:predicted acetyltransferase
MNITIKRGGAQDRLKFDRLMQLYIYDFTDLIEWDLNEEGLFETNLLDSFFVDDSKIPFLIRVADALAGFVLVSDEVVLPENKGGQGIKEFFVVRNHRRHGVGKAVAAQIFSMFRDKWEIRVMRKNINAEKFWEAVIDEYTNGKYEKEMRDDALWRGAIFSFEAGQ